MRHKLQPTICKNCKNKFQPNYYGKTYCCKDCYSQDHNTKAKCNNCGKEFNLKKAYENKKYVNSYCCRKCYLQYLDKRKQDNDITGVKFYLLTGFHKYEISKNGLVRNLKTLHIRKPGINHKGYYQIRIMNNNNIAKTVRVHRLMALNFLDNPYNLKEVNHKDGNKVNNNLNNLEWISSGDNQRHSYKLGLRKPIKERDHSIDFKIEMLLNENMSIRAIAAKLNVGYGNIRYYSEKVRHRTVMKKETLKTKE